MIIFLYLISFIIFFFIQSKIFLNLIKKNPNATIKQKAHYLSTLNAFVTSISGIYLNLDFFYSSTLSVYNQFIQIITISYFTSYLICDILFGIIFYKQQIQILTGYIHHAIYLFVSLYSIINENTLLYSLYFICEIPSFILFIGSLNSNLRMDKLFGFLFFITRIIYHSFLISLYYLPINYFPMIQFLNMESRNTITIISSLILGLHIHWFSKWVIKYY